MRTTIPFLLAFSLAPLAAADKDAIQRFGVSDLPTIKTKVRYTTIIMLPPGESISEVICGDKEYWVIEGSDSFLYVKPSKERAQTNINIVSKSKALYSFLVQEVTKPGVNEPFDVKVVLPRDEVSQRDEVSRHEEVVTKLNQDKDTLVELLRRSGHKAEEPGLKLGERRPEKKKTR